MKHLKYIKKTNTNTESLRNKDWTLKQNANNVDSGNIMDTSKDLKYIATKVKGP